jgi:hypothetical protein
MIVTLEDVKTLCIHNSLHILFDYIFQLIYLFIQFFLLVGRQPRPADWLQVSY